MNEEIRSHCRKIVGLWDTLDELYYMRIHTPENITAITKNIELESRLLYDEIRKEL